MMKTIQKANITPIFSIFILLIAFVNVNAQDKGQWEILNEGGFIKGIYFVNENVGWLAGDRTLFKTEDGGETWFSISLEEYGSIISIDFINESVGWAICWDETTFISKTTDGGQNWVIQKTSETPLSSICVVNDSTVYVVENGMEFP